MVYGEGILVQGKTRNIGNTGVFPMLSNAAMGQKAELETVKTSAGDI